MKDEIADRKAWASCTAEGARLAVLREGLNTTFREKLEWLEESENLSLRFAINRERAVAEGRVIAPPDTQPPATPPAS